MFCGQCGQQLSNNENNCPACGANLSEQNAVLQKGTDKPESIPPQTGAIATEANPDVTTGVTEVISDTTPARLIGFLLKPIAKQPWAMCILTGINFLGLVSAHYSFYLFFFFLLILIYVNYVAVMTQVSLQVRLSALVASAVVYAFAVYDRGFGPPPAAYSLCLIWFYFPFVVYSHAMCRAINILWKEFVSLAKDKEGAFIDSTDSVCRKTAAWWNPPQGKEGLFVSALYSNWIIFSSLMLMAFLFIKHGMDREMWLLLAAALALNCAIIAWVAWYTWSTMHRWRLIAAWAWLSPFTWSVIGPLFIGALLIIA